MNQRQDKTKSKASEPKQLLTLMMKQLKFVSLGASANQRTFHRDSGGDHVFIGLAVRLWQKKKKKEKWDGTKVHWEHISSKTVESQCRDLIETSRCASAAIEKVARVKTRHCTSYWLEWHLHLWSIDWLFSIVKKLLGACFWLRIAKWRQFHRWFAESIDSISPDFNCTVCFHLDQKVNFHFELIKMAWWIEWHWIWVR